MITNCDEELPNPHKDCLREILSVLIIHDNDIARINAEIRELKEELKCAIEKLELKCDDLQKMPVGDGKIMDFTKQVAKIDDLNECYTARINKMIKVRDEKVADAKQCMQQLNCEKIKIKQFHERTIDYLKKLAVESDDLKVIRNCEKDIAELHRRFVKEVLFIKKTEKELKAFFRMLTKDEEAKICDCCCFKEYEWVPKRKDLGEVQQILENIQNTMGKTLVNAFARMHVHQPSDPRTFLAGYLMNLNRNEALIQEKLEMFEPKDI